MPSRHRSAVKKKAKFEAAKFCFFACLPARQGKEHLFYKGNKTSNCFKGLILGILYCRFEFCSREVMSVKKTLLYLIGKAELKGQFYYVYFMRISRILSGI